MPRAVCQNPFLFLGFFGEEKIKREGEDSSKTGGFEKEKLFLRFFVLNVDEVIDLRLG